MTIAASGPLRLSALRTEYSGPTVSRLWRDYRRGTTYVKANAANNTAVNNSASIPTAGAIRLSAYRGKGKGWTYTTAATQVASAAHIYIHPPFGDDWNINWPKTYINNGTMGSTSTSFYPCVITGGTGTIDFVNNGEIQGAGGAGNGGSGQHALVIASATSKPRITNNGAIRGGGGGGGAGGTGGTGGQGTFGSIGQDGPIYVTGSGGSFVQSVFNGDQPASSNTIFLWSGSQIAKVWNATTTSVVASPYTYYRGTLRFTDSNNPPLTIRGYEIYRQYPTTNYTSGGAGGGGGAGGQGIGYADPATAGAAGANGAAGGTNAGAGGKGGTGGTGGTWGGIGGTGLTGANGVTGNYTGGTAGTAGGPGGSPGYSIYADSAWTFLVGGTLNGTYGAPVAPT